MNETFLHWTLLIAYAAAIVFLAWRNRRKATDIESFSVGSRQVPPFFIGLSLAANMTSVATFVINRGLIHAYGWSGVVGYGMAAPLGIFIGALKGKDACPEREEAGKVFISDVVIFPGHGFKFGIGHF